MMILADTSVWIDHFRKGDATVLEKLAQARLLAHPLVVGEIALGHLPRRAITIRSLQMLPHASEPRDDELLAFIENHSLMGRGIGLVDVNLLASARLFDGVLLWTRDKRLREVAGQMGVLADLA